MITIKKADPFSKIASELIKELSGEIAARYNFIDDGSGAFQPEDVTVEKAIFPLGWFNNQPVACGALRPLYKNEIAEIKRMFVKPEFRGKGIAGQLLLVLENEAEKIEYKKIWLETGDQQPEAIAMYQKAGYTPIPNYGIYKENLHSNCFEKILK